MKISCVLPPDINRSTAQEIQLVFAGLVQGWANLPAEEQRIIEWSGILLQDEGDRIEVEVKVVTQFRLGAKTIPHEERASFRVDALPGKIPEHVAEKLKKTVRQLLEELHTCLQKETSTVRDLLR